MIKIVCACDTGVVVSLMIALKVKQTLADLGIRAQIDYIELEALPLTDADLYVISETAAMAPEIQKVDKNKVISLKRILDKQEIENKLRVKLNL